MTTRQFDRRISLVVYAFSPPTTGAAPPPTGLDLSDFHIKFSVRQMDFESPNNAEITVYNLSDATIRKLKGEFQRVQLSAGYAGSPIGKIFDGTIKQLRVGRENNISRYVKILAADSDIVYNFGIVNKTLAAGTKGSDRMRVLAKELGLPEPDFSDVDLRHVDPNTLSRGKVFFGLAKSLIREEAKNLNATWSFQNGEIRLIDMRGYLPNQQVTLTAATGLVGGPEQTDAGINFKCLLNPKLRIGGTVKLDNASINQLAKGVFEIPYNQWTGAQFAADVSADGLYRVYVVEHTGDSRGQEWYSNVVGLAINRPTNLCTAKD